jgi:hypothetical protein
MIRSISSGRRKHRVILTQMRAGHLYEHRIDSWPLEQPAFCMINCYFYDFDSGRKESLALPNMITDDHATLIYLFLLCSVSANRFQRIQYKMYGCWLHCPKPLVFDLATQKITFVHLSVTWLDSCMHVSTSNICRDFKKTLATRSATNIGLQLTGCIELIMDSVCTPSTLINKLHSLSMFFLWPKSI